MTRTPLPPLLTVSEVQRISRATSVSTVRHWLATGQLPSIKAGRRRLVRCGDLARFLGTPVADLWL